MGIDMINRWRVARAGIAGVKTGKGVRIEGNVKFHLHAPFFKLPHSGSISLMEEVKVSTGTVMHAYGGQITIGSHCFIGPNVVIYGHGNISIGSNSLISMHTCIVSSNHTIPDREKLIRNQPDLLKPVSIGEDVWIGANSTILAGVTIGNGAVIGAGSVVTRDIPANAVALGNPAKIIRHRD